MAAKAGAVAIAHANHHIVRLLLKFGSHFTTLVPAAVAAGALTSAEGAAIVAAVAAIQATDAAMTKLEEYFGTLP